MYLQSRQDLIKKSFFRLVAAQLLRDEKPFKIRNQGAGIKAFFLDGEVSVGDDGKAAMAGKGLAKFQSPVEQKGALAEKVGVASPKGFRFSRQAGLLEQQGKAFCFQSFPGDEPLLQLEP